MIEIIETVSGRKVYKNYKNNINCSDKINHALTQKAESFREKYSKGNVKGKSRFGSFASEDALSWSVFRSLEIEKLMLHFFKLIKIEDSLVESIFWTISTKTEKIDENLKDVLDGIEDPKLWLQQTEPDIILKCKKYIIFIEAKLGCPNEIITGWARNKDLSEKHNRYKKYLHDHFTKEFIENYSNHGKTYYQLMRNIIIGNKLALREGKKFKMVALVNPLSKPNKNDSHRDKYNRFLQYLRQSNIITLVTWQQIMEAISNEKKLTNIYGHLKNHVCLQLNVN